MPATFVRSYADPALLPEKGLPQVAFLGRSNAGKSSLINSLTKTKELARTSARPGHTRLVNLFDVNGQFHLVDLPGYGFAHMAKRERETLFELIKGYLQGSTLLALAVVILDSRIGPTDEDEELIQYLLQSQIPFIVVANKTDKLSRTELANALAKLRRSFEGIQVFPHSAVTTAGRGELSDAILTTVRRATSGS